MRARDKYCFNVINSDNPTPAPGVWDDTDLTLAEGLLRCETCEALSLWIKGVYLSSISQYFRLFDVVLGDELKGHWFCLEKSQRGEIEGWILAQYPKVTAIVVAIRRVNRN